MGIRQNLIEIDRSMSERDRIPGALPGGVVAALAAQSRVGATGTLLVAGDPGGLLRLDEGRVSGAESPGAPGVEALLLRSGRILESSWVAAYQTGAPQGRLAIELVRRGLVGAAELEAVCLMALFDAVFALAAGTVEDCRWQASAVAGTTSGSEPAGKEPWTRGVAQADAEQLRAETERRLAALAVLPVPVRPGRDRLGPAAEPGPAGATAVGTAARGMGGARAAGGLRREVLALADGRRTARDIAFLLGRGVYPVTVEASRLLADGLLRVGPPAREGGELRALLAPRHAAPNGLQSGVSSPLTGPAQLPRRPSRASGS